MNALARLDDYLVQMMDAPASEDPGDKPKFKIETKEQAIWALRKIAGIEKARQESQKAAQMEISRIKDWLADEEKRADQARGHLDFLLEDYHHRQLAENPKAKTIKLPHGDLQLKKQQPEFARDDKAILDWARENRPEFVIYPPWIRPEPKLDWAGLKKALKAEGSIALDPETGEIIPGITVKPRPSKFSVKLSGV